jgi:hypothetical protein
LNNIDHNLHLEKKIAKQKWVGHFNARKQWCDLEGGNLLNVLIITY